jgi:prepilin-type N-terminal cleavage/methylation domain-containing protein
MIKAMFKNKNGFTLIELMLVVVLISVLSGVILSVINITGLKARSRDAQRAGDLKRIQTALELYYSDNRAYPIFSGGYMTVNPGSSLDATLATYVHPIPKDPRDGEALSPAVCTMGQYGYFYRTNAAGSKYVIKTAMESQDAAGSSACSSLANCSSGTIGGCNCAAPCYGVENPL